jgi:hypothetical protein
MKSIVSTLALATLAVTASLTQAHAQSQVARVNVPFAFNLGSEHFPAGAYTITVDGSDVLDISNDARPSQRMAIIESRTNSNSSNASAVTFTKYGNMYFLTAYSSQGATIKLIESSKERSLAHEYALSRMEPDLVNLALNQPMGR